MWQARWVASHLEQRGVNCELVPMDTKGDRQLDVAIPEIGSKGVFTEDLERELASGTIDLAVHSAKDMPSELPMGFELIAFTDREQAHDVLVSHKAIGDINQMTIGTSSVRRVALLKHFYPGVKTVSIRGNLQTRVGKLDTGEIDAVMLAYAGVTRMDLAKMIKHNFPVDQVIPAVGQGSMAIEVSKELTDSKRKLIRDAVNHQKTEQCLLAERTFLKTIQGGCSIPAFAHARLFNKTIHLAGGVVSLEGQQMIQFQIEGEQGKSPEIGAQLATRVLNSGGKEILDVVKMIQKK